MTWPVEASVNQNAFPGKFSNVKLFHFNIIFLNMRP